MWMAMVRRLSARTPVVALAMFLATWQIADTASAQQADLQSLSDRVERLQRELQDLQRAVYRGESVPAPSNLESSEGLTGTQAARLSLRISQIETALQTLTNQVEEAGFAIDRINGRLDSLVADVDRRLQALEAGRPVAGSTTGATALTDGAATTGSTSSEPGTLGTISQSDYENFQAAKATPPEAVTSGSGAASTEPAGAGQLPDGTPEEQYQYAFGLLRQANYAEAEVALKSFIDRHPESQLTGNALYWLGETYYVRGDYQTAAITFAEAYKNYPEGAKAPDNLLKLGLSLASLDAVDDACGTFSELERRYPNASPSITRRAKLESQKLSCP
jgi:tol-pal system protein YbgF